MIAREHTPGDSGEETMPYTVEGRDLRADPGSTWAAIFLDHLG